MGGIGDAADVHGELAADGVVPGLPSQPGEEPAAHQRGLQHGVARPFEPQQGAVRADWKRRAGREPTPEVCAARSCLSRRRWCGYLDRRFRTVPPGAQNTFTSHGAGARIFLTDSITFAHRTSRRAARHATDEQDREQEHLWGQRRGVGDGDCACAGKHDAEEEVRAKLEGKSVSEESLRAGGSAGLPRDAGARVGQASEWVWTAVSRRGFLKVMGASLALAGLAGCTKQPDGA